VELSWAGKGRYTKYFTILGYLKCCSPQININFWRAFWQSFAILFRELLISITWLTRAYITDECCHGKRHRKEIENQITDEKNLKDLLMCLKIYQIYPFPTGMIAQLRVL